MEQPITHALILNLEHLPPYQKKTVYRDNAITSYLEALAHMKLDRHTHYLELPSMSRLSVFFSCSFIEVYDAFRALQEKGYEYQFSSVDGTMLVWRRNNKEKRRDK
jgi:hypothetical protein